MTTTHRSPEQEVQRRRWRIALPVGAVLFVVAAVTYVVVRNPYATSITGPCMLLHTTGLFCPGCGGTRAVYDMVTGDFASALGMNAFVVLLVVPPGIIALGWWLLSSLGLTMPRVKVPTPAVWTYLAVLAVFAVLRNVPYFAPALSPVTDV